MEWFMSNDHDDQQSLPIEAEPIPYSGVTPGQLLREVREARGQTVAEVAAALRLRISLIEAIEADDYQSLNGGTFVRGYFRSLAKLYDIDPQPLADAYEAMGYGAPAVSTLKMQSFSRRKIREKSDGRLMLVSYIIIAAVIAAALVWWWQQPSSAINEMPQRSSIEAQPREADATMLALDSAEAQVAYDAQVSAEVLEQAAEQQLSEQATGNTSQTVSESAAEQATGQAAESTASAQAEPTAQSAAEQPAQTAAAQPAAQPTSQPLAADRLTMAFNQRCWVKVSDASGAEIAIGVKDAGYEMPLTGRAPFDIILCKPEALTMTLNGSAVDLSQYRRNRSVTLRLE
jgi:cytoskeleton protein RodZ